MSSTSSTPNGQAPATGPATTHNLVSLPRSHSAGLAFVALLGALAAALLWPALFDGRYLLPSDIVVAALPDHPGYGVRPQNPMLGDVVHAIQPWRSFARAELAAGRIPLWNPHQLTGTPLIANLQSAVWSPWSWLLYLWPEGAGLGWAAWLKLVLAGAGMGLFLRRLRLAPAAVVLGSLGFMLSSHMVAWLQWTIAEVYLLAPWLLWLARGWLDTRRPGWLLGWALAVALAIVGGHAESAFNVLLVAGLYALAHILAASAVRPGGRVAWAPTLRRLLLRGLAPFAGASALGVAIGAVQLLPFLVQLPASLQASDRAILKAYLHSLGPEALATWLVPNGLGNPATAFSWGGFNYLEQTAFVGLVTLALAPLAWLRGRRLEPLFWTALAIVAAGIAWAWPGFALLRELPGLSSSLTFRYQSLAQIGICVLGALGADMLFRSLPLPRWRRLSTIAAWLLLAAGAAGLTAHLLADASGDRGPSAYRFSWYGWSFFVLGALGALAAARIGGRLSHAALGLLLAILAMADLLRFAAGFNTFTPPETYYPRTPLTDRLAAEPGRGAVLGLELSANLSLMYGWRDYRAYDPMLSNRHKLWVRLMSRRTYHMDVGGQYSTAMNLWPPRADMFSAIGLRWVAARDGLDPNVLPGEEVFPPPPLGPAYVPRDQVAGFTIWENIYSRPFAYFAAEVVPAAGEEIWLLYRNLPGEHWARTYVEAPRGALESVAAVQSRSSAAPRELAAGEGRALVSRYEPGIVELAVDRPANRPGLLVVNESWDAGWRAEIDGAPAPLYPANYLEQALVVPGGPHRVRLIYWPLEFEIGAWLSLLGLIAWIGGFAVALKRRGNTDGGRE